MERIVMALIIYPAVLFALMTIFSLIERLFREKFNLYEETTLEIIKYSYLTKFALILYLAFSLGVLLETAMLIFL